MNDFNSRYRNIDDQPGTIRTNAGGFGYDNNGYDDGGFDGFGGYGNDMDIMEAENHQKKRQAARAQQARGTTKGRKSKRQMLIYGIIIAIEVIALVVIWAMYISYNGGSSKKSSSKKEAAQAEEGGNSGNINVENDNFSLACTKISITTDSMGSPVAVIYFTFANKTDSPLSMSQVYQPRFMQLGMELPTAASLAETPAELANKDMQVSGGQPMTCAYAVSLQDTTSEITITMHDNYETFSDIGTTVVPIS